MGFKMWGIAQGRRILVPGRGKVSQIQARARVKIQSFLCLFGWKQWDLPLTQWLRPSNLLIHLFSLCFAHHCVPGTVLGSGSNDSEKEK